MIFNVFRVNYKALIVLNVLKILRWFLPGNVNVIQIWDFILIIVVFHAKNVLINTLIVLNVHITTVLNAYLIIY